MQEIAQEENRIPLPAKASSSLRFLIYGRAICWVPGVSPTGPYSPCWPPEPLVPAIRWQSPKRESEASRPLPSSTGREARAEGCPPPSSAMLCAGRVIPLPSPRCWTEVPADWRWPSRVACATLSARTEASEWWESNTDCRYDRPTSRCKAGARL